MVCRRGDRGKPRLTAKEAVMSSVLQRISAFLRSPRGRQLVERGRRELAKPSTQQKLRRLLARRGRH
jgi:hypothetical protein